MRHKTVEPPPDLVDKVLAMFCQFSTNDNRLWIKNRRETSDGNDNVVNGLIDDLGRLVSLRGSDENGLRCNFRFVYSRERR